MPALPNTADMPDDVYQLMAASAPPTNAAELFLVEDRCIQLPAANVIAQEKDIHVDRVYKTGDEEHIPYPAPFVVWNVLNLTLNTIWPLNLLSPVRGELEVEYFTRQYIIQNFKPGMISLPYLLYEDEFGLYRNMYRSLLGIYLTPAGLSAREQTQRSNIFPITLGLFGAAYKDVVTALHHLRTLDKGVMVSINSEKVFLCAHVLAFTGDMPQQQKAKGLLGVKATHPCGFCLIASNDKSQLDYNIALKGRYHHQTVSARLKVRELRTMKTKREYLSGLGMHEDPPALQFIAPTMDLIRSSPGDVAHSEVGIAKAALSLLMDEILTVKGTELFTLELQKQPMPAGWARLQSPARHLQSYRMGETLRGIVLTALVCRRWLKEGHIRRTFLKHAREALSDSGSAPIDAVTRCLARIAKSNSYTLAPELTQQERADLHKTVVEGRNAFQRLFDCASKSSKPVELHVGTNIPGDILESQAPSVETSVVSSIAPSDSGASSVMPALASAGRKRKAKEAAPKTQMQQAKEQKRRDQQEGKATTLQRAMGRPNVHTGLHIAAIATDYALPRNVTTFSGEDLHRCVCSKGDLQIRAPANLCVTQIFQRCYNNY